MEVEPTLGGGLISFEPEGCTNGVGILPNNN